MTNKSLQDIKAIAFDADDTLWINETYFSETEKKFCGLLEDYASHHTIAQELLKTEIDNLALYGYGVKGYTLSMIEVALQMTSGSIDLNIIQKIIGYGKDLLNMPVELIDGVEELLQQLNSRYRLVVATKGDLLDQEQKLKKSGLEKYFHHIEIMSDKKEQDYQKLIRHLDINPEEFMMIGNSLRSDILPVLNIGGHAIHVPFHTTWAHEHIDHKIEHANFKSISKIGEVASLLEM